LPAVLAAQRRPRFMTTSIHPVRDERCRRRELQYSSPTSPKGRG
jgi:hypothetical protein